MPILKTENLSITFGGLKAVSDFSVEIEKNRIYGLIGPNGAGKTTVFNMLTGVYKPTAGRFYLDGEDLTGKSPIYINRKGVARTFQNIRLFGKMTVLENVLVGLHAMNKCDPFSSILRLPRYWRTEREHISSNLPYGKQRKLEIARALATNPKLLLLDEPAAGMNPHETGELMETIRLIRDGFDMTILLIEHDLKLVSGICEEVTVLNFGTTLAQGKVEDVLRDPAVVTAYLGE